MSGAGLGMARRALIAAAMGGLIVFCSPVLASEQRVKGSCAQLLVGGVPVPKEALSLMARAGKAGDELYFLAFKGTLNDTPRLIIVMGEEPVLSAQSALLRGLILKQFQLLGFGGGSDRGAVPRGAGVIGLDGGFSPVEGENMARNAVLAWNDYPEANTLLMVVGENHIVDLIDAFRGLGYLWVELPGPRAFVSLDGF